MTVWIWSRCTFVIDDVSSSNWKKPVARGVVQNVEAYNVECVSVLFVRVAESGLKIENKMWLNVTVKI